MNRTAAVGSVAASAAPVETSAAPVALYIHFPFCVALCPYCDFVVYAGAAARGPKARIASFMAALHAELDLRADALDGAFGTRRPPLETVYLGGGTPSLLPAEEIAAVMQHLERRFGVEPGAEVTLEVNPGPDERGEATALKRAGVTRLSIGAQAMSAAGLRRLGRRHRVVDVVRTVAEARAAGIGSISLDLLYDTPDGSLNDWIETLEAALALAPDHLSLYALTLDDPDAEGLTGPDGDHLPTTAGARRWRAVARPAQDEDRAAAEYHHAVHRLADDGWRGYEISNWARPGHESRHNLVYWQRRPYEAAGPGAHAFDGVSRRWTGARLDGYLRALSPADGAAPALPPGGAETVDPATAAAERVILGLRTDRGVPIDATRMPPLSDAFGWALAAELVDVVEDDRVVLTTRGRLLSNELFARLV
jgi:oxygen-independent coproporphyrinogen-3 oxidase